MKIEQYKIEKLQRYKVPELKALAKKHNLKRYSALTKSELIKHIHKNCQIIIYDQYPFDENSQIDFLKEKLEFLLERDVSLLGAIDKLRKCFNMNQYQYEILMNRFFV